MALGFDNWMGSISSLLHTRRAIVGSTKEYSVALVSNNTVVLISPLFPNVHRASKASSAKKLPGKLDDDTISVFSVLVSGFSGHGFAYNFSTRGALACNTMICDSFDFASCTTMPLTASLFFGFRSSIGFCWLRQSIVLWPTSLHKKHFSSFISQSFSLITSWRLDFAVRIVIGLVLNLETGATTSTTHFSINFSRASARVISLSLW